MINLFKRSKFNPIIKPNNIWWKVYNPGAIKDNNGVYHLYPRVMKKELDWNSRIAHAISNDGENFTWSDKIILERTDGHIKELRGMEDPRITFIDGKYYMIYAVYSGKSVMLNSAVSDNPNGPWKKNGEMLPNFDFFENGGKMVGWKNGKPVEKTSSRRGHIWNKSGALFPEKFDNKIYMIFGEYYIWLASSINGKDYSVDNKTPLFGPRKDTKYFDNTFIEMGPTPILTEKGWLIIYHGIDEAFRYQLGLVILDKNNPYKILYRSDMPIFSPRESYEIGDNMIDVIQGGVEAMLKLNDSEMKEFYKKARKENIMPQVTFCTGVIVEGDVLRIYYGAGDTSVCTAQASINEILKLTGL